MSSLPQSPDQDLAAARSARSAPIRTLHVDIEGGWGGSSRSLFELLRRLDRNRIEPLVAHRQEGPVRERYAGVGIPTRHVPEIASFAPRPYNSFKIFLGSAPRLLGLGTAARRLAALAAEHRAALIHLNYEGLFLLAPRLRRLTGLPLIGHSRTHVPENVWGRWLVRTLARELDYVFFISDQEEARFRRLEPGAPLAGTVLWNIAPEPLPRRALPEIPEIVYLGSIDWAKGTDRLVELAAALERRNAPPMIVVVYGEARQDPSFKAAIERRITDAGLGARIALRGHTAHPEAVLAGAFALVRPSRENDPWGRDVIEAARAGVPALATGDYQGVVKEGETGYLFDTFDADAMAARLTVLREDETLWQRISEAAARRGAERFGGEQQAARFSDVIAQLAGR